MYSYEGVRHEVALAIRHGDFKEARAILHDNAEDLERTQYRAFSREIAEAEVAHVGQPVGA